MFAHILPPQINGQPGYLVDEPYCGPITCLIACFIFPFVCCCPCDRRQEFYAINGGQPVAQYGMAPPGQQAMPPQYGYAPQPVYGQPVGPAQPQYGQPGPSTYSQPQSYQPKV